MTPDELDAAVAEGIARDRVGRGLPAKVEDPATLARVAAIFVSTMNATAIPKDNRPRRRRRVSEVPTPPESLGG